jgi:hypothetical protein
MSVEAVDEFVYGFGVVFVDYLIELFNVDEYLKKIEVTEKMGCTN